MSIVKLEAKVLTRNIYLQNRMKDVGYLKLSDLIKKLDIHPVTVYKVATISLTQDYNCEAIKKISDLLYCLPEEIYPEEYTIIAKKKRKLSLKIHTEIESNKLLNKLDEMERFKIGFNAQKMIEDKDIEENTKNLMHYAIGLLGEKEQIIIKKRYFEDKGLEETGKEIGISRERVRQIEAKALRKIKRMKDLKNKLKKMEFFEKKEEYIEDVDIEDNYIENIC